MFFFYIHAAQCYMQFIYYMLDLYDVISSMHTVPRVAYNVAGK